MSKKEKKTVPQEPAAQATEEADVTRQETPAETPAEEAPAQAAAPETEVPEKEPEAQGKPEAEDPVKVLEAKLKEKSDQLMRTLAEYDNFRKRSQKEKDALYADGKADAVIKLLSVADNLERAAAADGDAESLKKGVEMTLKQLTDSLGALNVTAFGEVGDPFDPNLHNGVMHEENAEFPENTVSAVFIKGYKLGDKVIRHATVKVAN